LMTAYLVARYAHRVIMAMTKFAAVTLATAEIHSRQLVLTRRRTQ